MIEIIDTWELFKQDREKLNERNDCVVRAIAVAFNLSYKEAHDYCKVYLRRIPRKGVPTVRAFSGKDYLSAKTIPFIFNKRYLRNCTREDKVDCTKNSGVGSTGLYLKKFLEKCDKSKAYIVLSSGHAYCVKEGKVYGNPKDNRTYVKLAYRVEQELVN